MKQFLNYLKGKRLIKLEDLLIMAAEKNLSIILKTEYRLRFGKSVMYTPSTIQTLRAFPQNFSTKFYYYIVTDTIFVEQR